MDDAEQSLQYPGRWAAEAPNRAAIVMAEPDEIIALGAVVADELYGRLVPVVVLAEGLDRLRNAISCTVSDQTVIAYANNRS